MCRLKSGIILEDKIFMPDYDHHTEMLEGLGISDTRKNAESLFVRAELYPEDGDIFSDIDTWHFNVDQDIVPGWFVKDYEKERFIKSVKEWAKEHVFIGVDNLRLECKNGGVYYIKDCNNATVKAMGNATVKAMGNATVNAWGNATVEAWDNATVNAWGNATVEAWDNATVNAWDNATVKAMGNATVEAWDNATVKAMGNATVNAWGNATVEAWGNATVEAWDNATAIIPNWSSNKRENIVLLQNATLKDCNTKTIYQSGDWQLVLVSEGKKDA